LHKLSAGDGYSYLTRQVASADEHRAAGQDLAGYYTATGNPPGRWAGAGAAVLGVSGEVSEPQMLALFGKGLHPDSEKIVARLVADGVDARLTEGVTALGRRFPTYRPGGRRAVAGYDLVFTPVKSVSLLWALGTPQVRAAVEAAHHAAVADAVAWLERHAAFTRMGPLGELQVDTHGLVVAAFDHRESRLGDPDLHTHVAVSNKVRAVVDHDDGRPRWLALDGRALYAAAVAGSERYNTRLEDEVARRLGVGFVARADTVRRDERPVREVAGVPLVWLKGFSQRRQEVEARYHTLVTEYREVQGRQPSSATRQKLAQQATLETREAKPAARPLADMVADWRHRAARLLAGAPGDVGALVASVTGRNLPVVVPGDVDVDELAAAVVAVMEDERATWSRWNLLAEIERQTRPLRFATAAERDVLVDAVFAAATAPATALRIASAPARQVRVDLVRTDGQPAVVEHGSERYTTRRLLDAELRLLDAAREHTRDAVPERVAAAVLDESKFADLDAGQRELARRLPTDDRLVAVAIGPAGAGKTTALRAACAVWEAAGRRVIPLATSAKAAEVLAADLDRRAENLHKFSHELARAAPDADPLFQLRPGDVVLVDEAGMAGTLRLDAVVTAARQARAHVRLVGDPWQLGAVESGGMLRLLVHDVGAVELTDLHRFADPAEAAATLQLRAGDPTAVAHYVERGRLRGGERQDMLDAAYLAWRADRDAGLDSVLVAATGREVTALNARAHLDLVAAGAVTGRGVELHDGTTAAAGDTIVTRQNLRLVQVRGGRDFVKNGDRWTVLAADTDGSLRVRGHGHAGVVRLPGAYVARDVDLGYAATVHRVQGVTVDTAHVLVTDDTTREALYVAASRARQRTHLYAVTDTTDCLADEPVAHRPAAAHEAIEHAVERATAEHTAIETVRRGSAQARPVQLLARPTTHARAMA
jgi:conjugative relaxase-like TrwC/TraI family protein